MFPFAYRRAPHHSMSRMSMLRLALSMLRSIACRMIASQAQQQQQQQWQQQEQQWQQQPQPWTGPDQHATTTMPANYPWTQPVQHVRQEQQGQAQQGQAQPSSSMSHAQEPQTVNDTRRTLCFNGGLKQFGCNTDEDLRCVIGQQLNTVPSQFIDRIQHDDHKVWLRTYSPRQAADVLAFWPKTYLYKEGVLAEYATKEMLDPKPTKYQPPPCKDARKLFIGGLELHHAFSQALCRYCHLPHVWKYSSSFSLRKSLFECNIFGDISSLIC